MEKSNVITVERIVILPNEVKIFFPHGDVIIFKPSYVQILDENKDLRYIDEVLALIHK